MARRKNGSGGISKRKDGRWEGRIVTHYNEDGLPITKNVLASSKSECAEKLKELKESITVVQKSKTPKENISFGEWMDLWYREYCSPRLKESTQQTYRYRIYQQIIPKLGDIPLKELKTNDLQSFYAGLKKNGRLIRSDLYGDGVSDAHIRSIHAHCRAALKTAVSEKLIFSNVADKCKLPPKKSREMQILSHEEIKRLLIQAKQEDLFELFFLDLSTGLRRGELLALMWDDVDFHSEQLMIRRQVNRVDGKLTITEPKTNTSQRAIKLSKPIIYVLGEYKKTAKSRWLFPSPLDENIPREPSAVRKRLTKILEHAGCKKVRFHDLRHTFATMALENGVDIKTLSDILGHNTAATALNTYTHATEKMRRAAAENIDRKIAGISPTESIQTDSKSNTNKTDENTAVTKFEPYKPRKRKSGTGYVKQLSDNCWQGRYSPTIDGKRMPMNVYGKTEQECEEKLAEVIREIKVKN